MPFAPPFTVALPWQHQEQPQVNDPDGNPIPTTLSEESAVATLSAPGSYILGQAPPPPPPEEYYPPEPQGRPWQELALPAVIITSGAGLLLISAIAIAKAVRKKMHERSHIRRRLYKKRARGK